MRFSDPTPTGFATVYLYYYPLAREVPVGFHVFGIKIFIHEPRYTAEPPGNGRQRGRRLLLRRSRAGLLRLVYLDLGDALHLVQGLVAAHLERGPRALRDVRLVPLLGLPVREPNLGRISGSFPPGMAHRPLLSAPSAVL